jgi:hypothetical protein
MDSKQRAYECTRVRGYDLNAESTAQRRAASREVELKPTRLRTYRSLKLGGEKAEPKVQDSSVQCERVEG